MPSRTEERVRKAIEGAGSQSRAPHECRVAHAPDALPMAGRVRHGSGSGGAGDMSPISAFFATVLRLARTLFAISSLDAYAAHRDTRGQVKFRRSSETNPLRRSLNFNPPCFWAQFGHGTQPS